MTLASIPPNITWTIELLDWVVGNPVWSVVILVFPALMAAWVFRGRKLWRGFKWALALVSALGILSYAYVEWTYCRAPQFYDHVEPQVAVVSYLLMHGGAVYVPADGAEQYSLQYGPFTYLCVAAYYGILGPSIFAVKVSGVVSSLTGVVVLLAALKRSGSWWSAIPCVALATTLYGHFDVQSFWCRADSHEIFLVSLSILAVTLANPWLAATLVGISAGICFDLKINALAYFLPIGTAFILRYRDRRAAGLAVVLAIGTAITPFLIPEISLRNYLACLLASAHQPMTAEDVRDTLIFAGWMAGILLMLGIPSIWSVRAADSGAMREWRWTAAALGAAIVVTLPFAAKSGAGPHHLMPLAPILMWLVGRCWSLGNFADSPRESGRLGMRHALIVPILVVAACYSWATGYTMTTFIQRYEPVSRETIADLGRIMDELSGRTIEMGVGGNDTEFFTYFRPLLVYAGNPYQMDAAAAMDISAAPGGMPGASADLFRSGMSDYVLIPKGDAPFSLHSGFPGHPAVYPAGFVEAFLDHYHVRFTSFFFDVYERNDLP